MCCAGCSSRAIRSGLVLCESRAKCRAKCGAINTWVVTPPVGQASALWRSPGGVPGVPVGAGGPPDGVPVYYHADGDGTMQMVMVMVRYLCKGLVFLLRPYTLQGLLRTPVRGVRERRLC